ncbi:ribosomal protein S18-alanine N-acetyltransferase [Bacillaceae bacterium]
MRQGQVRFRRMTLADVEAILGVERACFAVPWSREAFVNELRNNPFAHYLVVEKEEKIVGYGGMWLIVDEAHMTNIAIHPEARGKKLGYRLMRRLMGLARRLGAQKMTLEVRASNEVAQRLYRRLGFAATGIRPGYYSDNGEDAIIMWVNLHEAERDLEAEDANAGE